MILKSMKAARGDSDYHSQHLDQIENETMTEQEYRTRPSVLSSITPCLFSLISEVNKQALGQELHRKIQAGMERGLQLENDEQIRIFNEQNFDKQDPEVSKIRKQILEIRDQSHKFTKAQELAVDEDDEFAKLSPNEQLAYNLGKYSTIALMRIARKW